MNDERTDFEIALDDLLQVARHAPRTGEGYQEIQAARRAFLAAFPPPAPSEVRLTDAMVDAGAMVIPGKWENAVELSRLVLTAALAAAAAPGAAR